jgi:hypothetical protein
MLIFYQKIVDLGQNDDVFMPVGCKSEIHGEAHHDIVAVEEEVHEVEIGCYIDITASSEHDIQIDIDILDAEVLDVEPEIEALREDLRRLHIINGSYKLICVIDHEDILNHDPCHSGIIHDIYLNIMSFGNGLQSKHGCLTEVADDTVFVDNTVLYNPSS